MFSLGIVPVHIDGLFLLQLLERTEGNFAPELCPVGAMASLHLALLSGLPWINEVVDNAMPPAFLGKGVQARECSRALVVAVVSVGKDGSVVCFDSSDGKRSFFQELVKKIQGASNVLLSIHLEESPPRAGVHCGELIQPFALVLPHVRHVNLHHFSWNGSSGLPDIFVREPSFGSHHAFSLEHLVNPFRTHGDALLEKPETYLGCAKASLFPDGADTFNHLLPCGVGVRVMRSRLLLETRQSFLEVCLLPAMKGVPGKARPLRELCDAQPAFQVKLEPPFSLCGNEGLGIVRHVFHDTGVSEMIVHITNRA